MRPSTPGRRWNSSRWTLNPSPARPQLSPRKKGRTGLPNLPPSKQAVISFIRACRKCSIRVPYAPIKSGLSSRNRRAPMSWKFSCLSFFLGASLAGAQALTTAVERFNPGVDSPLRIDYRLTEGEVVDLTVYNSNGDAIRSLANGQMAPGSYTAFWDGKDANGVVHPGRYRLTLMGRRLFEFREVTV